MYKDIIESELLGNKLPSSSPVICFQIQLTLFS